MASSRHKHAVPRRAGRGTTSSAPGTRSSSTRSTAPARHSSRHVAPAPWRRQLVKVAVPSLGVLAVIGSAVAVVTSDADVAPASATVAAAPADDIITEALAETPEVNRSAERPELPDEDAVSVDVTGQKVALEDGVTIHTDADASSPVLKTLEQGQAVDVTGEKKDGWSEVVYKGLPRWVSTKAIADDLPLGTEPCPKLSESGMQPDTVKVFRAVCAKFPEISSYGAIAGRGEHATGHALDIMVRGPLGDQIAAFLQENRAELGIEYLIWQQRIWRPATSNSWRGMSDRGGDTANHDDHVHVTTYGNAATS